MVRKTQSKSDGASARDDETRTAARGRNGATSSDIEKGHAVPRPVAGASRLDTERSPAGVGKNGDATHCAGTNGRGQGGGGASSSDDVQGDAVPLPAEPASVEKPAPKSRGRRRAKEDEPPMALGDVCMELQRLQRERAVLLKSRNKHANRLRAVVAGNLGYYAAMDEKARKAKFQEAARLIKATVAEQAEPYMAGIIRATMTGVKSFNDLKKDLERQMVRFAKRLPVAAWVGERGQRGFGLLFLAIVVGETGDLFNYPNPAKVWRRLGCAPWTFNGETKMGATWRSGVEGKLPSDQWGDYGYSPRRRSISYLIGEGIVKQNRLAPESPTGADDVSRGQAPSYYGKGAGRGRRLGV
jgi:hypothetical protein